MHANPLFNVVHRLKQVGCDPCRVEANVWLSRCPACRAHGRTLVLTRASLVACGSGKGCNEERILAAMGLPGRQAYDATPAPCPRKSARCRSTSPEHSNAWPMPPSQDLRNCPQARPLHHNRKLLNCPQARPLHHNRKLLNRARRDACTATASY